jgi:hypothetical protein
MEKKHSSSDANSSPIIESKSFSCELHHVHQDVGKESRHDAASSRRHSDVTHVVIDDDTQFFASLHHPNLQKETITPVGPLSGTNLSAAFQLNSLASCRQTALQPSRQIFVSQQRNMHIHIHTDINTEQFRAAVML